MSQTQQFSSSEAPGGEIAAKTEQKKGKLTKQQRKQQWKEMHSKPSSQLTPQALSEEQFIPKDTGFQSSSSSAAESSLEVEKQVPPQVPSPGPSFGPESSQVTSISPSRSEQLSKQQQASGQNTQLEAEHKQRAEAEQLANAQEQARREASIMGAVREEEEERKRRIEEAEIEDEREGAKEASLIGTVIDEENERRRRIMEEYETYSEPLHKTKALEEIERSRRIHSYAEQARQKLAATASANLFPQAYHPQLPGSTFWTSSGLLRRETRLPPSSAAPQPEKHEQPSSQRYGEFIATTTRRTSSSQPGQVPQQQPAQAQRHQQPVSGTTTVETKSFMLPYSNQPAEIVITSTMASESEFEPSASKPKVCKETYQSSSRPRLIVHHTGLTGKWKRATETVELHEGVDF